MIYQYDPGIKQQCLVWLSEGENPPVKCKKSRSISKQMIAKCVFEAWIVGRPNNDTRGLLLDYDNSSALIAAATLDYLEANPVQVITQTRISRAKPLVISVCSIK